MSNVKYAIPKGMHDVLPQDSYKWQIVEACAREIALLFGCSEIRTPNLEHTDLFLRGLGEDTDVVSKEMYSFLDKGTPPTSLTLKPEGTAGVARSFVENSLDNQGLPLKMYYITPVHRYEKPQKGRYRQHHQFGVELYGSDSSYMDFEGIHIAYLFLNKLGLDNIVLNINSIGCSKCRPQYIDKLKQFVKSNIQCFCDTCKSRVDKNTLRVLDCKCTDCISVLKQAPIINDCLCEDCVKHRNLLYDILAKNGINYQVNYRLVRGLDYYSKTVFEWVTTSQSLGNQSTVCGGGRYDGLVESVGGKPTSCFGFGLGIERLIHLVDEYNPNIFIKPKIELFIMHASVQEVGFCIDLATQLRVGGVSVEIDYCNKSLKSQFKHADRIGVEYCLVIGETELKTGKASLRNMSTKLEVTVELNVWSIKQTIRQCIKAVPLKRPT